MKLLKHTFLLITRITLLLVALLFLYYERMAVRIKGYDRIHVKTHFQQLRYVIKNACPVVRTQG